VTPPGRIYGMASCLLSFYCTSFCCTNSWTDGGANEEAKNQFG